MMFVTAGRVGSFYKRMGHFTVMRVGVKLYKVFTGRDGVSRFKYAGAVADTMTLDRYIRDKKFRLAREYAKEHGAVFMECLKHNDKVPPLYALVAEAE